MNNLFVNLLFGHLVGDYFLQPKSWAIKKGSSNYLAALHCLVYTLSIAIFTKWNIYWLLFIFVSHFVVDRWSLADKWLKLINGRTLEDFLYSGHVDISGKTLNSKTDMNYRILRGSFSAIVYVMVDNGFHLISMYYFYSWFF